MGTLELQAMKKRIIILLVVAAIVAWLLKDRLVPVPEPPGEPAPFRSPPPPAPAPPPAPTASQPAAATAADDLTAIGGIGPKYAKRLAAAGVTTYAALAGANAAAIAEQIQGASEAQVAGWISQAAALS